MEIDSKRVPTLVVDLKQRLTRLGAYPHELDELIQDVFLKISETQLEKPPKSLTAYVMGIAKYAFYEHIREATNERMRRQEDVRLESIEESRAAAPVPYEMLVPFLKAQLDEELCLVFQMLLDGKKQNVIAETLGWDVKRVYRAKLKIKAIAQQLCGNTKMGAEL